MDEEEGEWSKCAKLLCWCLYDEDTVQKMYEMDYTDEEATGAGFTTEQMSGDPRKESDGLSSSAISPGKSLASVEWG